MSEIEDKIALNYVNYIIFPNNERSIESNMKGRRPLTRALK